MADTVANAANKVQQWSKKFYKEYVRDMQFSELIGKTEGAPIQMVTELETMPGKDITVSLITRLSGKGATGDNALRGNEIQVGNYGHKITIDQIRQACTVKKMEQRSTHIDLMEASNFVLKDWAMGKKRDDIIVAAMVANVDGKTPYESCTVAQRNAWLTANSDRVLYGAAKSNAVSLVHATALALVDSTNDVLTYSIGSLAKRMAKQADPHIRPIRVNGGGEWYVMLCHTYAFRDLKSSLATIHASAEVRGKDNPLFSDGDLQYDGVIYKEVEEIPVISGVGGGSIDVAPCFLLGAQAIGIAVGERTQPIKDEDDYGNIKGVGVAEVRGIDKLMFNDKQHGMLTLFVSGVADT